MQIARHVREFCQFACPGRALGAERRLGYSCHCVRPRSEMLTLTFTTYRTKQYQSPNAEPDHTINAPPVTGHTGSLWWSSRRHTRLA